MNNYEVTYFPPSAPQQATALPPTVLNVTADDFAYEDSFVVFVDNSDNPHRQITLLTIPLELMPIVKNLGPAAT
jgi:hypothetical protein